MDLKKAFFAFGGVVFAGIVILAMSNSSWICTPSWNLKWSENAPTKVVPNTNHPKNAYGAKSVPKIKYSKRKSPTNFALTATELPQLEDKTNSFVQWPDNWDSVGVFYQKIEALYARFKNRTLDSCNNSCSANDTFCQPTDIDVWRKSIDSLKQPLVPLFKLNEHVFPWERKYAQWGHLKDTKQLPDRSKSKVFFLASNGSTMSNATLRCRRHEYLRFLVQLFDGYGKARREGGDEIRVWTVGNTDPEPPFPKRLASAGYVTDLGNGSYVATVRCMWEGVVHLKVSIAFPREYFATVLRLFRLGAHRFLTGRFQRKNVTEDTVCFGTPNIPGRNCLCNLTSTNGASFYCGRPRKPGLSCKDWTSTTNSGYPRGYGMTVAEKKMEWHMNAPPKDKLIHHQMAITASHPGGNWSFPFKRLCSKTSPRVTWTTAYPTGFWKPGRQWETVLCQTTPENRFIPCMSNAKVWVFGDSNGNRTFVAVARALGATRISGSGWPYEFVYANKAKNIYVYFQALEYPIYMKSGWNLRHHYGGVASRLDHVPSNGRHVVVFHNYLHTATNHLSVFFQRLVLFKSAVQRLLHRNPDVTVAFRGPHISYVDWRYLHIAGGDTQGLMMMRLTREIFKDVQDRVVFLDGWEMTIADENTVFHPSETVPRDMFKLLLSFHCP